MSIESILPKLNPDSTLADLPLHEFRVDPEMRSKHVQEEFDRRGELPGVLVTDESRVLGIISRERFFQELSRPLALDVYMTRPVLVLLEAIKAEPLELPSTFGIQQAATLALRRSRDRMYEPVVVRFENGDLRLLNGHFLVLAQTSLLALANQIIQEQKEAADAANRAKGQFLANMSHEIRTPLNGIIGLTDIVLESKLSAEQREYLEMVRHSADWLMEVISEILDFSKIEAGKLRVESVPFGLRGLMDDMLGPLAFRAHGKGLELSYCVGSDVPDDIIGDPTRLRQVLVNLIGNAIKFTDRGEIAASVFRETSDDQDLELHFTVADTGVGIQADRVEHVFEAFEQADGSTTRQYGGTGLGLSISRRLVELMGGRIWVESNVGSGSTFHFTIPVCVGCGQPRADARTSLVGNTSLIVPENAAHRETVCGSWRANHDEVGARTNGVSLTGLRVLVAEDNVVNQKLAVSILEKNLHKITVVSNGRSAVEAAESENFDVILMDVQMPIMDGYAATDAIRKQERDRGSRVPIIAMTANVMDGDRKRCLEAGMDGYISKPINSRVFCDEISRVLADGRLANMPPMPAEDRLSAAKSRDDIIDWKGALSQTGNDPALLQNLVRIFLDESSDMLGAVQQAIETGNSPRLKLAAHALKGALGYFAASSGYDLAFELERMGERGDLADAATVYDNLLQTCKRIESALAEYLDGA